MFMCWFFILPLCWISLGFLLYLLFIWGLFPLRLCAVYFKCVHNCLLKIFLVATLISLSDNSDVFVMLMLTSLHYLFSPIQLDITLILVTSDFWLKPGFGVLWDSGSYLNLLLQLVFPKTTPSEEVGVLLHYYHMHAQFPYLDPVDTQARALHYSWGWEF